MLGGLTVALVALAVATAAQARGNPLCFRICTDTCTSQRSFCSSNAAGHTNTRTHAHTSGQTASNLCTQVHDVCVTRCHQTCNMRLN